MHLFIQIEKLHDMNDAVAYYSGGAWIPLYSGFYR